MDNLRKYIASLALVFALFAISSSEFLHHHDDAHNDDSKCEACLFNKVIQSSAVSGPAADLKLYYDFNEFLTKETRLSYQIFYSNSSGRSPPIVSHI